MTKNSAPIGKAKGACLCGGVTIAVSKMGRAIDVCHCDMCRKWGGGPLMGVSGAEFEITGKELIRSYASSNWAERAFCSKCGSNLWFRFTPADNYSFLAGLFGGDLALSLEQQIFVEEKPAYYDFAQDTPMKTGAEIIAEAAAQGLTFDD